MSEIPLRHDPVTIACPHCGQPFTPAGKRRYCTNACKAAAYRRRHQPATTASVLPRTRPRKATTVYECDTCGTRTLGQQRCHDCGTFMHRLGPGGHCPHCDEPVAITDLLDEEVSH
jgi:Zn finger protein HypA/HybF involved in hydrogenase expression